MLLLLLHACTWVTPADMDEKRRWLDDDGDGVPNGEDCAPALATEGPGPERPYDGLDNDCQDGDALDLDGDRWPGVDQATWETRRDEAGGTGAWPVTLGTSPDCDDHDASVRPDAVERFYDGLRTRCDTAHDFDADGDGWISLAWEGSDELAAWDAAWPDAPGQPGDCDDNNDAVHPEAEEVWYDGVDGDCAVDNDFDADGDGWIVMSDTIDYQAAFERYRAQPGYQDVQGAPGDCLDRDQAVDGAVSTPSPATCDVSDMLRGGLVRAALVHPEACDIALDGIDADCAGDDDFDRDRDGWYQAEQEQARSRYAAAWGYTLSGSPGDCVDIEPDLDPISATIHPEAEERLDDRVDQDCDAGPGGGDNTSALRWLAPAHTSPGTPTLAGTDGLVTLTLSSASAASGGWSIPSPSLHAYALDTTSSPPGLIAPLPVSWSADVTRYGPVRARGAAGGVIQVLSAGASGAQAELALTPLLWTPPTLEAVDDGIVRATTGSVLATGVDLWEAPDGRRWWVGCRTGELTVVTTPPGIPSATRTTTLSPASGACGGGRCELGSTCALLPDQTGVWVATCSADGCDLASLSASGTSLPTVTFATRPAWPGLVSLRRTGDVDDRAVVGVRPDGGITWINREGGFIAYDALSARSPSQAVGHWQGDSLWVWLVEESGGVDQLRLAEVQLTGLEEVWTWHTATTANPRLFIDAFQTADRLWVGVVEAGASTRVGWGSALW